MKQIWPNYSYSPATNVLTLTGLNIDRDQLLLVTAADRGRIMYNFADSSVTASAFTSGANTALTLVATTAGLTTTAALVIYYDDQLQSTAITISNFPSTQTIAGTVTANLFGEAVGGSPNEPTKLQCDSNGFLITSLYRSGSDAVNYDPVAGNVSVNVKNVSSVTIGNSVTIGSLPAISGTVTANVPYISNLPASQTQAIPVVLITDEGKSVFEVNQSIKATINGSIPAGTNRIGVVTIGAGTVTIGAGTAQIGSVTASISNSVTIASLPAISGTVTANAGTGTFNVSVQGATGEGTITTVTGTSSFTLKASNSNRKLLSVYNEGAGNLHILYGNGTVTTANYSVKLFSGDYLEIDKYTGQVNGLFATAGTARVTQIT